MAGVLERARLEVACGLGIAALAAAGCSDDNRSPGPPATASAPSAAKDRHVFAGEGDAKEGDGYAEQFRLPKSYEPGVKVPSGQPPARLRTRDLRVGGGPLARRGDEVAVNYVGARYSTRRKYDSSYVDGLPLEVVIGRGNFIEGFERAIAGMKVGGRREARIPAQLAYGESGYVPDVGPNEALVFVIDLEAMLARREAIAGPAGAS